MQIICQYYGKNKKLFSSLKECSLLNISDIESEGGTLKLKHNVDVVYLELWGNKSHQIFQIQRAKLQLINLDIKLIVIGDKKFLKEYYNEGVDDAFTETTPIQNIEKRTIFLTKHHLNKVQENHNMTMHVKVPFWKRIFDIVFATLTLLILSPIFLIVTTLIRIESKGPIFYSSKRVGTGYKIFDFYKFRSMYKDADKRISELQKSNQYNESEETKIPTVEVPLTEAGTQLLYDDGIIPEDVHIQNKKSKNKKAFFKIKDDPRITKVGKFIRNTSIDELPQLINVLKGDMSIVGNRPLPLYEAEKLTVDENIKRFLAPAGLTGLWQVNKRAKSRKMSAEERKMLDIKYATGYNFFTDLNIIFRTLPAMIQSETV